MSSLWEAAASQPLPDLTADRTADVCVVGLGGSGLAAVEELAQAGATVVGVDAGPVGASAAGRNGGFLLAGLAEFFPDLVARVGGAIAAGLYLCTIAEIVRLLTQYPETVAATGSLRIAADVAELDDCESQLRALRQHRLPAENYAGPEGRGLLFPTDAAFHPFRCLQLQLRELARPNVALFAHSPVIALEPGGVTTTRGRIACGRIVVAVDGRLETLLPELSPRVRTARLQMLATAPVAAGLFPRPVYYRHGFEYWQQLPGGEIVLGGFRDRAGAGEWTSAATPSADVQALLERFLRQHLKVQAPITHRWAASVAYTEDRLPVCGEIRPGIFACGGYSGTGNIVGRLCGRAAARWALGRKSEWGDLLGEAAAASRT